MSEQIETMSGFREEIEGGQRMKKGVRADKPLTLPVPCSSVVDWDVQTPVVHIPNKRGSEG